MLQVNVVLYYSFNWFENVSLTLFQADLDLEVLNEGLRLVGGRVGLRDADRDARGVVQTHHKRLLLKCLFTRRRHVLNLPTDATILLIKFVTLKY